MGEVFFMWAVFVGIPLGVLQVFLIIRYTALITENKKPKGTAFFVMGDMLLIIGLFALMATISGAHLLWAASGMAAAMIIMSVAVYFIKMKEAKKRR